MPIWKWYEFNELTPRQLYHILQLRELVFTIQQHCSEADMDNVDLTAHHFTAYENETLIAYLRAYQQDNQIKMGRIVVHPDHQKKGLGRDMMLQVIPHLQQRYPDKPLVMSAQYYLEKFYQSLGFKTISDIYLEAGIQHVEMLFR